MLGSVLAQLVRSQSVKTPPGSQFGSRARRYNISRARRSVNIWNVQDLRMHLAQKLSIFDNEILVNAATNTLDVGSCDCGGPRCFPASKTPIEFFINGKVISFSKTKQRQHSELYRQRLLHHQQLSPRC